jgi:hypothetical protein
MNPLYSQLVWFPTGYSMNAYNVLASLAPAISAWTAFLLCRRITRDHSASFVGGLLFGFSSYEVGAVRTGKVERCTLDVQPAPGAR